MKYLKKEPFNVIGNYSKKGEDNFDRAFKKGKYKSNLSEYPQPRLSDELEKGIKPSF